MPPAGGRTPPPGPPPQRPPQSPPPDRPGRGGNFRQPPPPPPGPEPGLLTHSELGSAGYTDDFDEEATEFANLGDEPSAPEDDDGSELTPRQRKKRLWRRTRRTMYVLVGLGVVIPAVAFTIAYFFVDVPTPEQVLAQQGQVVSYYYADNTLMGKDIPDSGDRQILQPGQIPEVMKKAAYAAEDATFETNSGFDVMGIFRAVFNNLTGGQGGGSGISQQYVKKATENEAPTLTRKFTELVKSFKLNQTQSKQEIIAGYLNIIYFGRNAYGIQAASHAYFNKDAAQLTPADAAFLAGIIQGPSKGDNSDYTTWRWKYVMDNMVKYHWLSPADRQTAQYPVPVPKAKARPQAISGPMAFIQAQVEEELTAAGYSKEKLQAGGYNIYTTIDPNAQRLAEQAVTDTMKGQPSDLKNALVAVDPKTRGVVAYYGGPNNEQDAKDWASTQRNPGSSFKAFDLAAFLKMGKGLGETFDGSIRRQFGVLPDGSPRYVNNASQANSCGTQCTVAEATKISANTVFFDMVANVTGIQAVADVAKEAGVTDLTTQNQGVDYNISIGGGSTEVTPLDMATGYSTFADNGVSLPRHFVAKVTDPGGALVYQAPTDPKPAFTPNDSDKSKQIAGNVTMALKPVIGFSHLTCPQGHECAGKTGTQQYDPGKGNTSNLNSQVWMVGYTPSISVASWVGTGANKELKDKNGKSVSSDGLPAQAWQQFITNYLKGKPPEKFDQVEPIGKTPVTTTEEPTSKPSTTPSTPPTTPSSPPSTPSSSSSSSSSTRSRPSLPSTTIGGIQFGGPGPNGGG
ncbi:transglycosylase domain-containing protein [Amycolatopsis pigmentata]|uniref:Transglycosylase domain-containing protein n=1 Tax=Amycolatopsis pigmentata TaxID=450801 RepID=A0ABW5FSX9_9PSEU